MKRVIVGLSGGVDSSVTAYLLKEQGYEVIGLFMKNWHDDSVTISNECPWLEDSNDALIVAEKLGIPFQVVDLSEQYKERIVDYMFDEYEKGRTPNPDILCNREIKFDVFMDIALNLGADYVATGHYCRKEEEIIDGQSVYKLIAGKDINKDQSYFLCQLSQHQLAKALFPIGQLTKPEVREIATKAGLVTAEKKDSQGLCFIGKVKLPDFLQPKLKSNEGKIINISSGNKMYFEVDTTNHSPDNLLAISSSYNYNLNDGEYIGNHKGAHFFTVGQRKGLAVGGTKQPLFVLKTDVLENIIYVGEGKSHPGLFRKVLFIKLKDLHLTRKDKFLNNKNIFKVKARIRYRQPLQDASLLILDSGAFLIFDKKQSAITKGQFAVWYKNQELLGSGVIS